MIRWWVLDAETDERLAVFNTAEWVPGHDPEEAAKMWASVHEDLGDGKYKVVPQVNEDEVPGWEPDL